MQQRRTATATEMLNLLRFIRFSLSLSGPPDFSLRLSGSMHFTHNAKRTDAFLARKTKRMQLIRK
jgi:hypothetical protein